MRSRLQLLLFPLLVPAWAAAAASSEPEPEPEPGDPNQHAATSPSDQLCAPGHYLTEDCYVGQPRMCCPCPPGTFLSHPNKEASCRPCTPCRKDQEMVRDCTPTRDRQCQCKPGEFYCDSGHCPEACHRCTSCPGATLQACTATRDTVCAAQPGPSACSLAVSALVVSVVTLVIVVAFIAAIVCWRRGAASVEPGSHGHILKTMDPESGLQAPNAETTQLLKEASTPSPGTQTRPGPSADPNPDPDLDTNTDLDSVLDPDPDFDTDTDLDPVLDPGPDTDTDPSRSGAAAAR